MKTVQEDVIEMFNMGTSIENIALELDISEQTVRRHLGALAPSKESQESINAQKFLGEIIRDFSEGVTVSEIARRYGTTTYAVQRALVQDGSYADAREKRDQAKDEMEELVAKAYREGKRVYDIAALFECSPSRIYQILARKGIAPGRRLSTEALLRQAKEKYSGG